ncbi:MAG: SPOR domain-containing protein [Magnetococcales bacterium]|nr:SPOR domain-containing protein [Magnetococcales bacterium]
MKISPNREQFMLVMIMNGLILFIVAALSLESLLSSRDQAARVERQVAVREAKEFKERTEPNETPETPPPATTPKVDVRIPEELTRPAHSPAVVKPHDGTDPRNEPARNHKPPAPIPGLSALTQAAGAGTPPPPPRPTTEETPEKTVPSETAYTVQLGAFSSEEKANTLISKLATVKLEGRPLPVSQQPIKVGNKVMYRVRLGPFASSARAKQAAGLVGKQIGVEGSVLGPGH